VQALGLLILHEVLGLAGVVGVLGTDPNAVGWLMAAAHNFTSLIRQHGTSAAALKEARLLAVLAPACSGQRWMAVQ
jgi:hypothetical protein